MSMTLDDLWFAGFLVAEGARLSNVTVLPYSNGRLQAFFELEDVPAAAVESYAAGEPKVAVHSLRAALNHLRSAMHEALSKRNGNGNNHQNHNQTEQPKTNQTRSGLRPSHNKRPASVPARPAPRTL